MIKGGAKPTRIDHRDYSHKSLLPRFGNTAPFPDSYNADAGLTMPDQNEVNIFFTPPVPAMPYGCTDYATSELATDLFEPTLPQYVDNPMEVENSTHANVNGGCDVRTALLAGKKLNWFTGIFTIEALDGQDIFDAIRDAMVSGGTEKRSVSVGSKWLSNYFENVGPTGLMPMPNFNDPVFTWHNWKICGWKTINDQVYLIGKSWQGPNYGDKGLVYFSRPLINNLLAIEGSAAFTATSGTLPPISTITVTWLQRLISYAHNLLPY